MDKDKRSFFERLTGSVGADDERGDNELPPLNQTIEPHDPRDWMEEENEEGQLTVDVYQTPAEIVIKTMVAGVKPENLNISITRDMVTIKGKREEESSATGEDYFVRELYWGGFSRTILLPEEVIPDEAEAVEKHGLLTIRIPKVDKEKIQKIKVKTG